MIINLLRSEESDIKYRILNFPDGQKDVVIETELIIGPVTLKSRINNFEDLGLVICAIKALKNMGVEVSYLETPYLLGARSDRQFTKGGTSWLRDVLSPILNNLSLKEIHCLDVHSSVAQAVIPNLIVKDNSELVEWALKDVGSENIVLVAPDAGAQHKIFNLAQKIGYEGEIITCSKERDLSTGKILETKVSNLPFGKDRDFIIIDDICDGGRTFIEIAKVIRANFSTDSEIYLIVTHGIFSQGLDELAMYFDGIYCTNSYRDKQQGIFTFLKQYKII